VPPTVRTDAQSVPRSAVALAVGVVTVGLLVATASVFFTITHVHRASAQVRSEVMQWSVAADSRPVAQTRPLATALHPMGDWTQARGQAIAERAVHWLAWPYSFGAGNESGPTYGMAVDHDSRNDAHVFGFDCSGLTIYALGPWRHLDHSAAAQYRQVGKFHPRLNELQPGDLVFWSHDGTVGGIQHVAVYIGDGKVVQAPRSGAVIRVSWIDQVESGDMGATRPLT
jgi:cell wall-associated NlpC family hydrolase